MTDKNQLTIQPKGCILKQDADAFFSVHYWRNGWHRRILWRECDNEILIQDPRTKRETSFGWVIHPQPGLLIAVLRHI
jgi:hypothetical protein